MKKGSISNHQSSQDLNHLEVAYAFRIIPDVNGLFHDCPIFIIDVKASISTCEIPGFVLKLKI